MKHIFRKLLSIAVLLLILLFAFFNCGLSVFAKDEQLSKYSSVDYGYIRPAENQYNTNNCWAFTTLGVISAYSIKHDIHSYDEADYSEAHLAWFNGKSRSYDENDKMYGDGLDVVSPFDEGSNLFMSTFTLAKGSGIAWEVNYPFEQRNSKMGNYSEFDRYDKSAAILTEAKLLNSTDEIKSAIKDYGAVEAGIYFDDSKLFNTVVRKYESGRYTFTGNCCYLNKENSGDGHEIMIVGWDDNYPRTNFNSGNMPQKNGAWLCKNSWGSSWGENGFFWISYENGPFENVMTYACVDGNTYDDIYQYDGYGFNRCLAVQNKKTASAANVFNANDTLTLERVGFYTYQESLYPNYDTACKVNVDIYTNLPDDYDSPVYGNPEMSFSVNVSNSGYHTVELPNSIAISKDSIFSVVVSVTASQGNAVMLIEGNQTDKLKYNASEKTSYLSFGDKTDFFDTAKKYGGNVCIKAYTKKYEMNTVSDVCITSENMNVSKGSTGILNAVIKPFGQSGKLEWMTDNENVVSISNDGHFYAVGNGEATITASADGKSDSIKITVLPVNFCSGKIAIKNNPKIKTIDYGDTLRLEATVIGYSNDCSIGWYVNGIKQNCNDDIIEIPDIKSDLTVTVVLEDKEGNRLVDIDEKEICDSEVIKVNSGFFKKIVSFFKNLFRKNRIKVN